MAKKRSNKSLSTLTAKLKSQTQEINKLKSQKNKGLGLTNEEEEFLFADPANRKKIEDTKAEKAVLDVLGITYEQKRISDILSTNLSQDDIIEEYQNKGDERQVSELQKRVSTLEKETRESLALAMSMIAVNKELINRVQKKEKTATAKKDTGPVTKEDTSTSILNKMYTFFVKGSENDKRNYEIQRDFAEERALESKRRKATAKRRPTASKVSLDKPSSNPILDLIGFISKGIGDILGFIGGGLFGIISKGLGGIKDIFMKIPGMSLLGSILSIIKDAGIGTFSALFNLGKWATEFTAWAGKLSGNIIKSVFKILFGTGKIIFNLIWPLMRKVITNLVSKIISFIPGLGSAAEATGVAAVEEAASAAGIETAAGSALAIPAATVAAVAGGGMIGSYLADKSDIFRMGKEWVDLRDKREDIKQQISDLDKQQLSPEHKAQKKAILEKQLDPIKDQMGQSAKKHYNDVLVPAMMEAGYEPKDEGDTIGFFKKGGFTGKDGSYVQDEYVTFARKKDGEKAKEKGIIDSILEYPGNQADSLKITQIAAGYMTNKQKDVISNELSNLSDPNKLLERVQSTDTYKSLVSDAESDIGSIPTPTATPVSDAPVSTATPATLPIENSTGSVIPEPTAAPAPVSTATPTVTPPTAAPAPTEQREDDSASVTPDTTRPAMVTPSVPSPTPLPTLSDMSEDVDVGSTQVVNMPSQSNASYTNNEYTGSPSVRNPNPVVYRTAMRNDQAQLQ